MADILAQPLKLYFGLSGDELRERSVALLERVRLRAYYLERLPGQLSGGKNSGSRWRGPSLLIRNWFFATR